MKFSVYPLAAALLLATLPRLQADPFTYESPAELSSTLDADGDGRVDLLIVDKSTGTRQLAMQQADGSFVWLDPVSSGLDRITALAVGSFTPSSLEQGFAVASPQWNRLQVWPAGSVAPIPAEPPGIGPNVVVALDVFGNGFSSTDGIDDLIITTQDDDPPGTGILGGSAWNGSVAAPNYTLTLDAPYSHANRARFNTTEPWMLAAMQPVSSGGSHFITRPVSPLDIGPTVESLPDAATWVSGDFANTGLSDFLFYAAGATSFASVPTVEDGPGHFSFHFDTPSDFDLGSPIAEIIVLPKTTGAQLLVIFGDGSTAGIYDFDGVNAPVLRESLSAPAGSKFSLAGALGAGNFLLLNGSRGGQGSSTGWQRWNFDGNVHTLASSGTLPGPQRASRRANVLVYGADPNLTPTSPLLKVLQAGEWSVSASVLGGVLEVTSQRSVDGATGLGSPATASLGSGFDGNFPTVNQNGTDASVATLSPAVGPPVGEVAFTPSPGTYHLAGGAPLAVQMTATPALPIQYRTGSGQTWTTYNPASPLQLSSTTTIRAYAGAPGSGVDGMTPTRTVTYIISDPPAIAVPPFVDNNHNGIADSWEQAFGLTDPEGDADGDGFSNRDEFLAGTDPLDPNSKPTSSDLTGVQLTIRLPDSSAPAGTLVDLVWPANLVGAMLETTLDLSDPNSWTRITSSITTTSSERLYHHPASAGGPPRFFRLRAVQ